MIITKSMCSECLHKDVCSKKDKFETYIEGITPIDDEFIEMNIRCKHFIHYKKEVIREGKYENYTNREISGN